MWGTITALGQSFRPGFMSGSSSNTSRPHLKVGLAFRWFTSATSSMTGPRAAFTSTASGYHRGRWGRVSRIRSKEPHLEELGWRLNSTPITCLQGYQMYN